MVRVVEAAVFGDTWLLQPCGVSWRCFSPESSRGLLGAWRRLPAPTRLCFAEWLQSSVFSGGLQTSQIHYSYNEEKDEDHCSSPGGTPASKSRLCSHGRALGDHSQAFLQAIADNNTQDHNVKVCTVLRPRGPLGFLPGARAPGAGL